MVGAWLGQARLGHNWGTVHAWVKVGAWLGHDRSMAPSIVSRLPQLNQYSALSELASVPHFHLVCVCVCLLLAVSLL